MDMSRMMIDTVMLKDSRMSSNRVGSGIIMTMRIPITPRATSCCCFLFNSENLLTAPAACITSSFKGST